MSSKHVRQSPVSISRRTILRGAAGAIMGLPLLDAMAPRPPAALPNTASQQLPPRPAPPPPAPRPPPSPPTPPPPPAAPPTTASKKPPTRMAVLYMANGVNTEAWAPKTAGPLTELSPTLAPLECYKDDLLVFSELWNAGSVGGDGHYVKTAGFLTGTTITKTTGRDLRAGDVSVDQLAAQHAGRETPLPSLELGIEPVTNFVDDNVGYTALYGSHIAWSTPTTPLAKEINPRLAFDRLFRSTGQAGSPEDDRSILDLVADDAKSLRNHVGKSDRIKLDEYFDSVRAVEKRIAFTTKQRADDNKLPASALAEIEALDKRIATWADPQRQKLAKN